MTTDVTQRFTHKSGTIAVLTFSILVVLGSVSPWMTTPAHDWNGLEMFLGFFTAALALVTGGFAIRTLNRSGRPFGGHRYVNPILAAILVLLSVGFAIAVDRTGTATNYGEPVDPDIGWGLILVAFASTALLASAIIVLGQSAKR